MQSQIEILHDPITLKEFCDKLTFVDQLRLPFEPDHAMAVLKHDDGRYFMAQTNIDPDCPHHLTSQVKTEHPNSKRKLDFSAWHRNFIGSEPYVVIFTEVLRNERTVQEIYWTHNGVEVIQ